MTQKLGRNDPCYCNGGKKFKNCHLKPFLPKEYFEAKVISGTVANTHVEYRNGKYTEAPGILEMTVFFVDPQYDYPEVSRLLGSLIEAESDSSSIIRTRTNRLHHKLSAIKYHMNNFKREEDERIKQYHAGYHGENIHHVIDNPKLIYEVEAFLFQVKSCMDVLAQIIGIIFRLKEIHTYEKNGQDLMNQLINNCPKQLKGLAPRLVSIIEREKKWISDIIDMRNDVTHYSDLEGFSCFINRAWTGGSYVQIFYPSMPDGERARTYLDT